MNLTYYKNSGDLYLPKWLKGFLDTYLIGDSKSLFYLNVWSINHILSGILLSNILLRITHWTFSTVFVIGLILHCLWEIWQVIITNTPGSMRGIIDVGVDTVLFCAGMFQPVW